MSSKSSDNNGWVGESLAHEPRIESETLYGCLTSIIQSVCVEAKMWASKMSIYQPRCNKRVYCKGHAVTLPYFITIYQIWNILWLQLRMVKPKHQWMLWSSIWWGNPTEPTRGWMCSFWDVYIGVESSLRCASAWSTLDFYYFPNVLMCQMYSVWDSKT